MREVEPEQENVIRKPYVCLSARTSTTWLFRIPKICLVQIDVLSALQANYQNIYLGLFYRLCSNQRTYYRKEKHESVCLFSSLAHLNNCSFESDSKGRQRQNVSVSAIGLGIFYTRLVLDENYYTNNRCLICSQGHPLRSLAQNLLLSLLKWADVLSKKRQRKVNVCLLFWLLSMTALLRATQNA